MKYHIAPLALGLAIAVAGFSLPARAQDEASVATAVDPQAAALVRRYFDAIQFNKLMNGMIESMAGPMMADGPIPEDKRDLVRTVLLESYEAIMPQMMEAYVALYAEAFTVEELEGLVGFYESPVGRALMSRTVMLTQKSGELYTQFVPILEREMMQRLCARMDCDASQAGGAQAVKGR